MKRMLVVDFSAFLTYALAALPSLTGVPAHEWFGLALLAPVFVHCAKRQHDVNMRVAVTLVVIEEITDHALIHKFLLTEIADEGKVLLISQFTRQSKEHRTRRLRVDACFRCVHCVPECLRVGIRFRRVGRQHDFNPLHAR